MIDEQCSACEVIRLPDELNKGYWSNGKGYYCWECHECYNEKVLVSPDKMTAKGTAIRATYKKREWKPVACFACQGKFIPRNAQQRYCSVQCRKRFYNQECRIAGRFIILERDQFRCIYCGDSSIEDTSELHVDHIVPRKLGGSSMASNLITACAPCNVEKSAHSLSAQVYARLVDEVDRRNIESNIDPELTIRLAG